jgi:hypothetical protein
MMRYIKTFSGIILYILFTFIALLPVLVIRVNIESVHYTIALIIWAISAGIFFLPALAIIIKKVWFFKGTGEPVALDKLKKKLLEINVFDAPVSVQNHKKSIIFTWRHQEQSWCELLEEIKPKRMYELWINFDNSTKTVTMSDKYRSIDWTLSPIKLETGWFAYSKPYFNITIGKAWGIENYKDSNPNDYKFSQNEIKSPVLNTIIKNGWNVRFSLF